MSNEELAVAIRAGERDKLMELWGQVRRLVHDMAYKRPESHNGPGCHAGRSYASGLPGLPGGREAYDPSVGFRFPPTSLTR